MYIYINKSKKESRTTYCEGLFSVRILVFVFKTMQICFSKNWVRNQFPGNKFLHYVCLAAFFENFF